MLINCPECLTSFRFRKTWFKGYKGARIRCRNCGGMIVVLNPAMSRASPPKVAGPVGPVDGSTSPSAGGSREKTSRDERAGDRMGQGEPSPMPVYNNRGEIRDSPGTEGSGAIGESAGIPPVSGIPPEIRVEAEGKEPAKDGFDISERISREPSGSFTGQEGGSPPHTSREPDPSFSEDDVYAPMVEVLPPGHGEGWSPEGSSSGIPSSLGYSPRPAYKLITDFALITVVLVFGGVCGYFAVRYILSVIGVDLG